MARSALLSAVLLVAAACRLGGKQRAAEPPAISPEAAAARGLDLTRLATSVSTVLDRAVRDSAFPGAIAVVGSRNGVLVQHAVGRLDWRDAEPPDVRTVWDLASLTKVVALTSAIAVLHQRGALDLDAPVQRYLPEFSGSGKEGVTVRHLLTHSSGLPSWRPLYKEATSPGEAIRMVLQTPLDTTPGARMVYSDLGAILLGQIVEHLSGTTIDRFVTANVFGPLRMADTRYRPPTSWRPRIAPTEVDPWRQRHLRGEVHDENAFALGGVSGHAGLFSTAADLSRLARMFLGWGVLDGVRVLDSTTIARFATLQDERLSSRALGWEKASGSNSGGRLMSPAAFGHTGFTGTSLWIDPGNDVFVILLTNRVNPTRENRKIGEVRISLADAVLRTVRGCADEVAVLECARTQR